MRRTINIIKYAGIVLLALLLAGAAGLWYLYSTADMMAPHYTPPSHPYQLAEHSGYRQYGPNFLRRNDSGLWELYVEGDAFRRGEAIGHLTEDLLHYQEDVFVGQIRQIIPSDRYLKFLRFFIVLFNRDLGKNIPEELRQEIYAISLSCSHEYDMIGTPYERQLNYHAAHDLGHAMQDYMLVGCSSFAAWGKNSSDSTLIVGRNFDFYMGDDFARNKVVAFYRPSTGYNFVTIGWAGMTGVLSGMNEHGLTVTINAAKSTMPTASATPISILTRRILQYARTIDEAYAIARKHQTFVSESILIGSAADRKAAIIEKSPHQIALVTRDGQQQIICTNHFQSETFTTEQNNIDNIRTSDSPYRFARLEELLATYAPLDPPKSATILRDYRGKGNADLGLGNEMAVNQFIAHHSVIFKPEQRIVWVSTAPWQMGQYIAYDLNKIFAGVSGSDQAINDESLTIAADTLLGQPAFEGLMEFKRLTPVIRRKATLGEAISGDTLARYRQSNPNYFYTYEVLGDYYFASRDESAARQHWRKALTLPIPRQSERQRIEKKLKN